MKQRAFVYLVCAAFLLAASHTAAAQTPGGAGSPAQPSDVVATASDPAEDQYFRAIYQDFYENYKLGPGDEVAVRVYGQPDYSLEKTQVSPAGRIYHPLLGDVRVAGMTVARVTDQLTTALSQFIINPRVSVSLLTANSALIGIVGDVTRPGILVLSRPMTILDALSSAGGVSDFGNKSSVTLLRRAPDARLTERKVNVKRILEGKANPEENVFLKAGDTIVVHGNFRKKFSTVASFIGIGRFMDFLIYR